MVMKVVFSAFPTKPAFAGRQVAQNLATTFLRDHLLESACPSDWVIRVGRLPTTTSFGKTCLISYETPNTENTDKSHGLDEMGVKACVSILC